MLSGLAEFVVLGTTMEGKVFQPQDWAEQLCARLAAEAGADLSAYLHPETIAGVSSLIVRATFREGVPRGFEALKHYVADNHLTVRAGRGTLHAEHNEPQREVEQERRDPKRNAW